MNQDVEPKRSFPWLIVTGGAIYVIVAVLLIGWLGQVRSWSLQNQDSAAARADWQQWRDDAARAPETEGSVQRRIPKSAEPPLLILMRDHYVMSVAATLFFWTALFVPLLWMVHGVTRADATPLNRSTN